MLITLDLFRMSYLVKVSYAVALSNSSGAACYGWPISISVTRDSTPILALTCAPAISASEAALIAFLKTLASVHIGTLMNGLY